MIRAFEEWERVIVNNHDDKKYKMETKFKSNKGSDE